MSQPPAPVESTELAPSTKRRRPWWLLSLAAGAIAASLAGWVYVFTGRAERYPQPTQRQIELGREYRKIVRGLSTTFDPTTATLDQLRQHVATNASALAALKIWIATPEACVPLQWQASDLVDPIATRAAARLLWAEAKIKQAEGRSEDAAESALEIVLLNQKLCVRRLGSDFDVFTSLECFGLGKLANTATELPEKKGSNLVAKLQCLEANQEPVGAIVDRDERWRARVYGWRTMLPPWFGNSRFTDRAQVRNRLANRATARTAYYRLAQATLAIEAFRKEQGRLPKRLDELVPSHLNDVLLDPWTSKPLIYEPSVETYRLYCVGQDGVDNGGKQIGTDLMFEPEQ